MAWHHNKLNGALMNGRANPLRRHPSSGHFELDRRVDRPPDRRRFAGIPDAFATDAGNP